MTALVKPPAPDARRNYAMAATRVALLHSRLLAAEIETIAVALDAGMIDADAALQWLDDIAPVLLPDLAEAAQ